jgi:signal transduction histidine kinase
MVGGVRSRWCDAALALGATLWHLLVWAVSATAHPAHPPALELAVLGLPTMPLFWLRSHPRSAFAAVGGGYLIWHLVAGPDMRGQVAGFFVLVALYAVARRTPPPASLVPAVVTALLLTLPDLADAPVLVAVPAAVWLLGWGRRRLAAARDLEARTAVLEERARIARDLHDVVAHHVSAIAVLARTSEVLFDEDPAAARTNLALLGGTADTALTDMRRLIGAGPAGGDVDDLVRPLARSGYDVTVEGDVAGLPGEAYRIVQEGLTNVLKHAGPTRVRVAVGRHREGWEITVENDPAAPPRPSPGRGGGRGLIGVRERAALLGGRADAGPRTDGGWRLTASLPAENR